MHVEHALHLRMFLDEMPAFRENFGIRPEYLALASRDLNQRETRKQASPIVTRSSSRAMKMSLMFNPATNFLRIS